MKTQYSSLSMLGQVYAKNMGPISSSVNFIYFETNRNEKDGGGTYYQNALRSEIVSKSKLKSVEEQA